MSSPLTRILTIGECMVEMAPREDGSYSRNFAGDSFNTAWYLRRCLPEDAVIDYCTAVGEDSISDQMLAFMRGSGIGTDCVRRIAHRTVGLYMIELVDGERSFIYWRDNSAAKLLAEDENHLSKAMAGRGLILFSGITLAILSEAHRDSLLRALAVARRSGSLIAFDPNMRLRLWPDRETMAAAITEAAGVADVLLPSFDEDQSVFGDTAPQDTIERYRARGGSTVVVKNGGGPVQAWNEKDGAVHFQPVRAETVVDTTAAGDSFNAGFLAAAIAGATLSQAIERASLLAAQVIQKRGALVDV